MIDLEKRKRIMQRSIKLGHCICNPKKSCPCDIFKAQDICPCAGERPDNALEEVRLTRLVEKAGCASKINQNDLKKALAGLPDTDDPRVLVGTNTCDDAGVYKLTEDTALVHTVDVFMPSADDPYTFGQIAAANSLSDVYAMGGTPLSALSIIGFPIETLSPRVMTQMLRGGMDKMREAGVTIIGGHSINDHDPKFGYAVTGVVNPSAIVANAGARPGDVLVLTKPLGVGIVSFAAQLDAASDAALAAANGWMSRLNKTAAEVMCEIGVSAATDVTGFGLLGHLSEVVRQSRVIAQISASDIPIIDEVLDYVSRQMISGGVERNKEHSSQYVTFADDVSEEMRWVLFDPQTSGGLLISVPEEKAQALIDLLIEREVGCAAVIGRIVAESDGEIVVANSTDTSFEVVPRKAALPTGVDVPIDETAGDCCCGGNGGEQSDCCANPSGLISSDAEQQFSQFCGAAMADNAISLRTKELMAISLSVVTKCEPCVKIHINKARKMGISEEEISEAVWMAVMFGGAPTMMFYNSVMEKK